SHLICRLFGISLQTRYRPPECQAQPSAHSAPVHNRWIGVLPILYLANRESRTTISASGYRTGSRPLQSRCAPEDTRGNNAPPAAAALIARNERRSILWLGR